MVPTPFLMVLAQIWPKFTQTRSRWLRKLWVLESSPLQQAPPSQARRRLRNLRLPVQHLSLKGPMQQMVQSVYLGLLLDRLMAQRHQHTLTAPLQDLAEAPSRLHESSVLPKFQKEDLGQSHLHQATRDLSHHLVIQMIHMPEARDLHKLKTLIQLIKDSSLVMCGVVLASI